MMIQFQFHKGAIRTHSCQERTEAASRFQFHKGAIRTIKSRIDMQDALSFQFHKGAIRTPPRYARRYQTPISIP